MREDQVVMVLRDKTDLDVAPASIHSAIAAQSGDIEAATKQVLDWWVTGESRSKNAGSLLLAALRTQKRPETREDRKERDLRENREFQEAGVRFCKQHMPNLPLSMAFVEWAKERYVVQGEPDPAKVRRRVQLRLERTG